MYDVDEAFVRSLLTEQHPDLAQREIRAVAGGWDNQLWRLGADLAVRIPRTPRAPALLRTEQRWLPVLAPGLPLPTPVPVRIGEPSRLFPHTWHVTRWVPGHPADREPVDDLASAGHLGEFLRALHRQAPDNAPANRNRGVPLAAIAPDFDACFEAGAPADLADGLRAVWSDALAAASWDGAPRWLHADLHPANVVVTDGTLTGVIDFGEMCAGDPATDVSAAWLLLPSGSVPAFVAAYGPIDQDTMRRARGWAVLRGLNLVAIGRQWELNQPGGKRTWGPAGRAALERVLADNECSAS